MRARWETDGCRMRPRADFLGKSLQSEEYMQLNADKARLITPYEEGLDASAVPYLEYPRPSMRRESYMSLNGEWDFSLFAKDGAAKYVGKIRVPFAPESRLSGVETYVDRGDQMIYRRNFVLNADFLQDVLYLHVDACDQHAKVYVNGTLAVQNSGGYVRFSADITDLAREGENEIVVIATDNLDRTYAYGKQCETSHGMWYTKVSGIWQSVWLESVPKAHIKGLKIKTDLKGVDITLDTTSQENTVILGDKQYNFSGDHIRIEVDDPHLWTADDPYLYDIEIVSGKDRVKSYFGLRTVEIGESKNFPTILVNGKPTFFHGLLDQGYYPDGIFLPATPDGFRDDIIRMKNLGFNMLRKHIKLEPELFYYYCDKYGMYVFQDMINNGDYNFLRDTVLPTIGLKKGIKRPSKKVERQEFLRQSKQIVDAVFNHPCVVYYTIFNEGWGQFDPEACYVELMPLDPTRVWDTASGWFRTNITDVISDHVYFKKLKPKKKIDRPWVLSEFGGYSLKVDGHVFCTDKAYGYKTFETSEALTKGLADLYLVEVVDAIKAGLCAAVLTQVSDVEEEINGMLTYDRKVQKVDEAAMQNVAKALLEEFDKNN